MGKNIHGGAGHKKFGRKFSTNNASNRLRVSHEEAEKYAIVTKMLGNNMFHCYCIDNVMRLGRIPGKFSGRHKRDNIVANGKWVLVGIREWSSKKMQECELLEIYSDSDKKGLIETVDEDWRVLDNNDISKKITATYEGDSDIVFSTDADIERERLLVEMKSTTTEKIAVDDTVVNFDDI